ncbi:MAG: class I SAM-dependent methyltransferase [Cyclobacteriaceae bacterium]|nr:class I SAM-dependent methyltransferase [Cyclobacteriaceae bacterium]
MTLEEVAQCPVCQSTAFHTGLIAKDQTTTGEVFHVKHCQGCTLGITSPRPREEDSPRYYQSETYISHSRGSRSLFDSIYLLVRHLTIRWKYRLVKPYLKNNGLLDVGCGTGHFLQYVARRHPVVGVEPSVKARETISPAITVVSSVQELPDRRFGVITLWHVIEHVYPLRDTLQQIKQHLAPGGVLFLAVPNHQSADALHYREHWAAYDVPRHLWHFNRQSMATLLQQEGMKLLATIPMKLDAYYVSLLSERYKRSGSLGPSGIISAVTTALQSNHSARKDGNYSSLIFVIQA